MDRTAPGLNGLLINNIFCIGRNYALHAKEMDSAVPEVPMVFLKPNSSILFDGGVVRLPEHSSDVHHEVELVIAIGREGRNLQREESGNYIAGIAVGIDFTARDIQSRAKQAGKPWSVAKGFDTFAPVSHFLASSAGIDTSAIDLELLINGTIRQKGSTADMLFTVPVLIEYLSSIFTLQPGDLIFTGTPEGVGPVRKGDKIMATAKTTTNLLTLNVDVQ